MAMMAASGVVSFTDARNLASEAAEGLIKPRPPSLTGRASKSLVSCEQGGRPVSEGMNH